ncbi:MAG: alpha-E domain-containing protein [Pirellulales bacterium]|jgi:uncharacterized alpha-E superfamily protein
MLSRVAESIYWLNRQIERAENIARATETTLDMAIEGTMPAGRLWNGLICAFGDQADFWLRHGLADQRNVIEFLAFDRQNPNSIVSCLAQARENARTVREMISSAMWQEINRFYLEVCGARATRSDLENPLEFLTDVKRASQLITGVTDATMAHGEAWHFAQMGRLIERADKTSRVLDVEHFFLSVHDRRADDPAGDDLAGPIDWSSVLESASALEMYRKVHGRISRRNVVAFLLLDREFPRAVHFCLTKAEESLLAITGGLKGAYSTSAEQKLGRLRADFDYAAIDEVLLREGGLHGFIDHFQTQLNATSDAVYETFFATRPAGKVLERQSRQAVVRSL